MNSIAIVPSFDPFEDASGCFFSCCKWFFYTILDTLTEFKGDWYAVAKSQNVPVYSYIPLSALNSWLLNKYIHLFTLGKTNSMGVILPEIYPTQDHRPVFGGRLAVNF